MSDVAIIGLDLAKNTFQVHGVDAQGATIFNKKLHREELHAFFESLPECTVGMEACAGAHYWSREVVALGHKVRILPARYVKAFAPRGKTDAGDAAAISQAVRVSTIHPVPIKSASQQAATTMCQTRAFLVRQRAGATNALRGHMAEFGLIGGTGAKNAAALFALLDEATTSQLPSSVRIVLKELADEIESLSKRIDRIDAELSRQTKNDEEIERLLSIPGIGKISAWMIKAYVPDATAFRSARQFASWLGLTPKANSSGGRHVAGGISKMGNAVLRSLLFLGAKAVIVAGKRHGNMSPWLRRLIARRPFKVAATALANKTARIVWALLAKGGFYRDVSEGARA